MRDNLTQHELVALSAEINVADGHPRQRLTASQTAIVERMPDLFRVASDGQKYNRLKARVEESYLSMLGQHTACDLAHRRFAAYSSSVLMMVTAQYLALRGGRVALVHPTFDNIADILRGRGLDLVPLSEQAIDDDAWRDLVTSDVTAMVLTVPNNPTGWCPSPAILERIAESCSEQGVALVLDASFRSFDTRTWHDFYAVLEKTDVEYLVIEDTGKLFPLLELKMGLAVVSEGLHRIISRLLSDVLLSISPFVLALLEEFVMDAREDGLIATHMLVARNRAMLNNHLLDVLDVELLDRESRISVQRLRFGSPPEARAVHLNLRKHGVHVLPCAPFYWASQVLGTDELRIALARDEEVVRQSCANLRIALLFESESARSGARGAEHFARPPSPIPS